MEKYALTTKGAPAAVGPYSQAIEVKGAKSFVFLSGQIPLDPETGEMVTSSVAAATERVLLNMKAVLAAAGLDFTDVVKTTVFIADMNDFAAMNEVYARYFTSEPPARATVQAARLPKDSLVEIEAIAVSEK
ncbi:MAG TPA: RidA family protein [bacterium]|nr:RidA family protein [bacterium]